MRKLACTGSVALLALLVAAPAAPAAVVTKASLASCQTGSDALQRKAGFDAQMGTIPGARKLQLRFDLYQRLPGDSFKLVSAPGLSEWKTSTARSYRSHKDVVGLQAPAAYRAVVRFRWVGGKGVLKNQRRTTAICRQPGPGIDLAVGAVKLQKAGDRVRYQVTVRNDGLADASGFDVALTIGGDPELRDVVESLGAGANTVVSFVGRPCQGEEPINVHVDPDGRIEQTDRTNDQKVVHCPPQGS